MNKHTPGPWIIYDEYHIASEQHGHVASVELKKDAALIAAAPELLEALERIAAHDPYNQSSAGIIASDAIAKAKGETQ